VNRVMDFGVPYNFWKFLNSWATGSFSRRAQLYGVVGIIIIIIIIGYNKAK
jgi:hypothetical protein